jgi:uncharacterized repeat protein (TIGR03987 family)
MPVVVMIGVLAIVLALVLYSVGVWSGFRKRGVGRLQVTLLWLGVACDVGGTSAMASSLGYYRLDAHGILGTAAMIAMAAVAAVATYALVKADERLGGLVARWATAPWVFWVAMFLWGMASRAPKR